MKTGNTRCIAFGHAISGHLHVFCQFRIPKMDVTFVGNALCRMVGVNPNDSSIALLRCSKVSCRFCVGDYAFQLLSSFEIQET